MTTIQERRAPSERWVRGLHPIVVAWAASRTVLAVGLLLGGSDADRRFSWSGFVAWDGQWYLRTARLGYGPAPAAGVESPWPFFPALPGALRALDALHLPAAAVMVLANHLLLLVAMIGVWRLAERHLGTSVATWSVWSLAVFPMSAVFSMLYPSSIFLAASVWAFELAERRRWAWCGVVAALATMVRPNGAVPIVVLTVAVFATAAHDRRWRQAAAVLGPSAILVAAWLVVCAVRTGNPFVFVTAKAAWREHTVVEVVRELAAHPEVGQLAVHLTLGVAAALALRIAWTRLPRSWRAFAVVAVGLPMVTGVVGLGRYANECFPVVVAGGVALAGVPAWARYVTLAGSSIVAFVAAVSMGGYHLLP
jgi:Dolichyl-phosphate-mannose-protein mannosyltransferase